MKDEQESLFDYNVGNHAFNFYNNGSIKPTRFPGDLVHNLTELFKGYTSSKIVQFYRTCGGSAECLIDIAVFGSQAVGLKAKRTESMYKSRQLQNGIIFLFITYTSIRI